MSKKISGAEFPLAKIFSSEFDYVIPSYQRPYAWAVDQASELFDDLYDFYSIEPEEGYFLGSIVLIKEEGKPYSEVIDGQQRLTTLTILLSAITSFFTGDLRSDFESYIREPGRASQGLKPKPRLSLRDRDREFFSCYVQSLKFEDLLSLDQAMLENESQRNVQSNSQLLLERLEKKFSGDEERLCGFGAFLVQRCFLVAVSTPNQQSAFRVFSVMNSRGLDLQPTDIIKAKLIGKIDSEELKADYNNRWEDMEVELGRSGFNDLFSYIRMIYAKEKAKRALLEEFETHVISKVGSPEVLIKDVLEPFADALDTVKGCSYEASANAQDVNDYLKWLNKIDNSDWIPSAILFLSQERSNPEYVLWFFKRLERLAAHMHITARNVNQRIERYAELVKALESPHDAGSPVLAVELTEQEKEDMLNAIDGNVYELTARRRNYLVLRLDSFLSDGGATYEPKVLTLEHVLPQTVDPDKTNWAEFWPSADERKLWVHRLANLVPLNQRRNSAAKNYNFDKKKQAYFGGKSKVSSYILTTQVLHIPSWTPEVVSNRQKMLLSVLNSNWELGGL